MPSSDSGRRPPRVEVATLGEALLRLHVRPGDRIEDAAAFDVDVAGSEANVAYALARVGVPSSWASVLPRNPLGRRVASVLRAGGVDLAPVVWADEGRLGTFFVDPGRRPRAAEVTYDREGSTMARADPGVFDWDLVTDARHLHISGITFAFSAQGAEVGKRAVRAARDRGCTVSLDVNFRSRLWAPEHAAATLRELAGDVDLLICKGSDARTVFGLQGRPRQVAAALQDEFGTPAVACSWAAAPATLLCGDEWFEQPAYAVDVVDRIGAGDAFAAGLLTGFLEGAPQVGLHRGVAMAALKMTLRGDLFTLDRDAVDSLMAGVPAEAWR